MGSNRKIKMNKAKRREDRFDSDLEERFGEDEEIDGDEEIIVEYNRQRGELRFFDSHDEANHYLVKNFSKE